MSQTSYATALTAALAGMLCDIGPNQVRSMRNQESVEVPFGLGIAQGTADDAFKLPAASGDKCVGITMHTQVANTVVLTNLSAVEASGRANILTSGHIWVSVEGAVAVGGAVYMRYASGGGGSQKGSFRADADTSTASLVKGARYRTSTSGAGLAQVEFDDLAANT